MSVIRFEPLGLFNHVNSELNRFINTGRLHAAADQVRHWTPAVDIREEAERYILMADIPGVERKDVEITLKEGVLTISGDRMTEGDDQRDAYRRQERMRGSFLRRFTLPDTVDTDNIGATVKDGVLEVIIPKQAEPGPRKITVN